MHIASFCVFGAAGSPERARPFGLDFDGLLFTFARVDGITPLNGLAKTALDKFPLKVELNLLEFIHKVFAIEALPGNGHKIY